MPLYMSIIFVTLHVSHLQEHSFQTYFYPPTQRKEAAETAVRKWQLSTVATPLTLPEYN